ncbi:PQQ-dependent sugar dehydrogenase [Metabacillus idriensis]|uniref:PQQ-dependent sugar dehydrogenase n=1 Tax=Metabacillus idriensis TaxID=324768 RepID=UPI003D284068
MIYLKRLWVIFFSSLVIAGCQSAQNDSQDDREVSGQSERQNSESILKNLDVPWSIAKNNNVFYLSERTGQVVKWDHDTDKKVIQKLKLKKKLHLEGEGGFLGFQLAPDFEESRQAFAYHTYKDGNEVKNRIVILEENADQWEEVRAVLEDIPGAQFHNGGRLKIGPDGKLYATAGDSLNPDLAQDKKSLAGKILRLELDGSVPGDNPFPGSFVYSYGHRNPQGLAWDEKGSLFSTEHGQSAHDEINWIQPGKNYGWPVIEGDEQQEGMEAPLYHTGEETWAPSGIAYKQGILYVATLTGNEVKQFEVHTGEVHTYLEGRGRMRDVIIEDDRLYTVTNNRDGRGNPRKEDDQMLLMKLKPAIEEEQ